MYDWELEGTNCRHEKGKGKKKEEEEETQKEKEWGGHSGNRKLGYLSMM